MKRILHKIIASAIMLIALQITLTAQPVGSQIKTDTSGHISYWNGVDAWIPVAPGLPGQTLKFTSGVPSWVNNPNGITTLAVSNITGNTALSGGNVISDGGAKIIARGVCWSTSPNPTIADNKTIDGGGIGGFTSFITGLTSNTTYFVRVYATNSFGTDYSLQNSFMTTSTTYPIYDIEGNGYDTIHIDSQVWMKQNLITTTYNNGNTIPNVTDNSVWGTLTTGAYSDYNNSPANSATYGRLYNWYAVNTGNLCPIGWHVPSNAEWTTLITYLGGSTIAGGKLKEAGLAHWNSPNTSATNESGFTALPGGYRFLNGTYSTIGNVGAFWGSDDLSSLNSSFRRLQSTTSSVANIISSNKKSGYSIRCLKN